MFIKPIEKPRMIMKLEALKRRLPKTHPLRDELLESLARKTAGYKGEKSLTYYLDYLPIEKYMIFHNLRLFDGVHYFQLDMLLLTRRFIIILEIKNMIGTIYFDTVFHQLIRRHNEKEESFSDPLLQVNRHKNLLDQWLLSNKFPQLPIETFVVVSKSSTRIEALNNHHLISQKVIHKDNLLNKIDEVEEKYKTDHITSNELKKLTEQLLKHHEELDTPILGRFEVEKEQIMTGVQCPQCGELPMNRVYGAWHCPFCNHGSKQAHIFALNDYGLLVNRYITKREIASFLHINSLRVAKQLIHNLNLSYIGENKGRIYDLADILSKV